MRCLDPVTSHHVISALDLSHVSVRPGTGTDREGHTYLTVSQMSRRVSGLSMTYPRLETYTATTDQAASGE